MELNRHARRALKAILRKGKVSHKVRFKPRKDKSRKLLWGGPGVTSKLAKGGQPHEGY